MNKSAKNSVAIFLTAALLAGVFSVSSPSIIDTEATEEKKYGYEKEKEYAHDERDKKYGYDKEKDYGYDKEKDYGYDKEKDYGYDKEKKYAHDERDKKYGYDKEKDYGYDKENKYAHDDSDKKVVKYVSCQNININGKSFQKDGMNRGHSSYGQESSYPNMAYGEEMGYGAESSYGENSYSKPDFVKETHKDVTVICIQKNAQQNKTVEPTECEDCFKTRSQGGPIPGGLIDELLAGVIAEFGVANFAELCDLLDELRIAGNSPTVAEAEAFLNEVWMGQANPNAIERLIDCLLEFDLLEETP
jgi:hypothetical protein